MEFTFSLQSWSAWSTSRPRREDWINWAAGRTFQAEEIEPDVSMVPAMKRRRMSTLSKMAFAVAYDCMKDKDVTPVCVFGSRHGELKRTLGIVNEMVLKRDISPTDFSLSVHNTALGLYSILTANELPSTTVVGGDNTFGAAMIEAMIHLNRFPDAPVLLVVFDEPAMYPLSSLQLGPEEAFGIALLLCANESPNIVVSRESVSNQQSVVGQTFADLGVDFIRFFLSDEKCGQMATSSALWHWRKIE